MRAQADLGRFAAAPSEQPELGAAAPAEASVGQVDITGVSHTYEGGLEVLNNIDVTVGSRQFVSIVGRSGCGKTTLLNMIAGLVPVEHGQISISGTAPCLGRHDVAYMLARDGLFPWLTTARNVQLGHRYRGTVTDEVLAHADELLERVGLSGFRDVYPKALSHGMRQRAALARTFSLPSKILLMDEPFGALDAQTKLELQAVLLSLWESEHRTVLFITHDLSEAVVMSDRILVMGARPGRIVADIPVDLPRPRCVTQLQADEAYHRLYARAWRAIEDGVDSAESGADARPGDVS